MSTQIKKIVEQAKIISIIVCSPNCDKYNSYLLYKCTCGAEQQKEEELDTLISFILEAYETHKSDLLNLGFDPENPDTQDLFYDL